MTEPVVLPDWLVVHMVRTGKDEVRPEPRIILGKLTAQEAVKAAYQGPGRYVAVRWDTREQFEVACEPTVTAAA